jgi:hypothetical protein
MLLTRVHFRQSAFRSLIASSEKVSRHLRELEHLAFEAKLSWVKLGK